MSSYLTLCGMGMIKTEKELLRLIWKEMGLGGNRVDIKKRIVIAEEIHNVVEFEMKNNPPERCEEVFNAVAGLFLSRIDNIKNGDCQREILPSEIRM
jgi:hypothetical protein